MRTISLYRRNAKMLADLLAVSERHYRTAYVPRWFFEFVTLEEIHRVDALLEHARHASRKWLDACSWVLEHCGGDYDAWKRIDHDPGKGTANG